MTEGDNKIFLLAEVTVIPITGNVENKYDRRIHYNYYIRQKLQ